MHNPSRKIAGVLCAFLFLIVIASARATIVWDLNPNDQNAPVGGSSHTFTSSGFSITAYGFDNHSGIGTAHDLFYKNVPEIGGAVETGLGLVNTPNNELQAGLHFIQFDFTAALAAGMFNGQLSVGSIQANESFTIFGSNTLGTLGTQVSGVFGSAFDNQFVAIPGFGQFNYYSVLAMSDDVLPVAIRADLPAVPEMNALIPVIALLGLVIGGGLWRQRRRPA
ncbi:MAG: hypothetical protein QOD64_871 [Verrucomicrobiota bacterium]|jgi:hypothetical protein